MNDNQPTLDFTAFDIFISFIRSRIAHLRRNYDSSPNKHLIKARIEELDVVIFEAEEAYNEAKSQRGMGT